MASNYKVNANGKWRFFETEEAAKRFCVRSAEQTGVVLAIVATEKSKKATKAGAPVPKAEPVAKPKKAARPAAAAKKEVGPTEGILGLLARGPATTAEIHAAFPHTTKSDVTTRIRREGWTRQPARGRHEITAAGRKRLAEIREGGR
ncbi:MAG TPA: hypothetical protein VMV18_07165 [bacterium]|nr:hypothetical protein [bacterium]